MPFKPRRVQQLLAQNDALKPIYAKTQQQQQLLAKVRKTLPAQMARHCKAAILNGTVLNLLTDSPVWVSKMRFQSPNLLTALRPRHPGIASIKVRCEAPLKPGPQYRKRATARHSNRAANWVDSSAGDVENPALRSALLRLARALKEK